MADQIHVVPHFHWDREWYFTAEESKILLVNDMEEVLTMLETNPAYPCFILDGQTSVLEDYFSVKPENRERVKKLVGQGKLVIGPWYTQTDEMVVGGESIVRNLLYGTMDCEALGTRMDIGYLPDSFGQTARLPQILNGFGIRRCMFWRGTSERMGTDKTEFYWEGEDGARVTVQLLPLGYAIGKYLPAEPEALKERLDKYLPVLDKGAVTDHILLPNGHDQMPLQKNIFQVMEQIEAIYPGRKAKLGRYEEVFDLIEQEELAVLSGEFLDGKYMRVHRSIYSSRADLKASNTRIENKLTNILEPLMSIAYSMGFSYEHGLVEAIWKELLKNHAHDSIGCCCSDRVHRAIADRFFLAEDRTDSLINFYQRRIADAMDCEISLDKLTVFNLLPYERTGVITGEIITRMKNFVLTDENNNETVFEILKQEVVDAGLIDRQIVHYGNYDPFVRYEVAFRDTVPAMGYQTYFIKEHEGTAAEAEEAEFTKILENSFYKITVLPYGALKVEDKKHHAVYDDVLLLEDGSDDGDGYDFSPLEQDFVLTSKAAIAETVIKKYTNLSEAVIKIKMEVPKNLESRKKKVCDAVIDLEWKVVLKADSPVVSLNLSVENRVTDHRIRVLLPVGLSTEYSICDNQFGMIRRQAKDDAMDIWEAERWSERPDSIYPFLSYVHGDVAKGLAFLTNSVREYELIGDSHDTLAVTVFRSVGLLGKENLYRRPGRPSGIKMETQDSQLIGNLNFEFAFTSCLEQAACLAKEYLTPIVTYNKMPYHAMKLNPSYVPVPYNFSLFTIDNPEIILSVLKKSEKKDRLLLRCYNPSKDSVQGGIIGISRELDEVRLDESMVASGIDSCNVEIKSNQIRTFSFAVRE